MKKNALAVSLLFALLFSAIAASGFVSVAEANPAVPGGTLENTLLFNVTSPQNDTVYAASGVDFVFRVSPPLRINVSGVERVINSRMWDVYYSADWLPNDVVILRWKEGDPLEDYAATFIEHEAYYQIPDGEHNLTITAEGWCTAYLSEAKNNFGFQLTGVATISFTVDTAPPKIVIPLENKTYNQSDITVNFAFNEPVSQIVYALDGGENLLTDGNTTLTGLANGEHNVTVYATDLAGNIGAPETVYFNVELPEPFPTVTALAVAVAAVVPLSAGLLVYHKKRSGGREL